MGWVVPASTTPALVGITWRPQRTVNLGLLVSAAGACLCALLIVFGRRRRPEVVEHRSAHTVRFPAIAVVAVGALASAVVTIWAGPIVVAVVCVALKWPRFRRAAFFAAVGCLTVTGTFVAGQQFRHRYQPGFGWPQSFATVHPVALLAVVLLFTDALLTTLKPGTAE